MTDDYQRLHQQADRLYHRLKDVVDNHAAGDVVAADARNVAEDFEMNKQPRSIEDRVKRVTESLKQLERGDGQTIDFNNLEELVDNYEELREEIRELDNY